MSSLFGIGQSALGASYAAMRTTGHNISNAGTTGYSRQQVDLATAGGTYYTGSGFFGRGVDVVSVRRVHDQFLAREVVLTESIAKADSVRADQLRRLESIFPMGEAGIGFKAGELLNSFADVATRPQDSSARQVVLGRATDVATAFASAAEDIEVMQAGITEDLTTISGQVTSLARQVADINREVVAKLGLGHPMNDLLDQRDEVVRQISSLIGVTSMVSETGAMNLFVAGGQMLVIDNESSVVKVVPNKYDPSRASLAMQTPAGDFVLPDELLTAGSVGGLLRVQGDDLVVARSLLGQMAAALSSRINDQQALGIDLTNGDGKPLFSIGAPEVKPAARNARDAGGQPIASYVDAGGVRRPSVAITVTNATELQAAEYELKAAESGVPGDYTLTRLPDGTTRTIRSGDVVDGFRFDLLGPAPAANDRFLLQPVGSAARYMRREMDDPRGIAAAAPVIATVGATNTGTATPSSLRPTAVDNALPPMGAVVTFGAATPAGGLSYTWDQVDAGGATVASGTGVWNPGDTISSQSLGLTQRVQWDLRLVGVPRTGDTVSVSPIANAAPNNGNAEALLALRDERLVGRDPLAPAGTQTGVTITDAWARSIADVGLRVQTSRAAAQTSTSVAERAVLDLKSDSGVNLDEEAARLMQFQQSYQAAAKILQVAQTVFDTLLRTAS
jgi:flagellar hook-associated protein 1